MRHSGGRWWTTAFVLGFGVWAFYEHRWNWTPDTDRRLALGLVFVSAAQAIVVGVRRAGASDAATMALTGGLLLGAVHYIVWLTPCPIRDRLCSAPEMFCEHGILAYALPVLAVCVGLGAALVGAGAAALATLARRRRARDRGG